MRKDCFGSIEPMLRRVTERQLAQFDCAAGAPIAGVDSIDELAGEAGSDEEGSGQAAMSGKAMSGEVVASSATVSGTTVSAKVSAGATDSAAPQLGDTLQLFNSNMPTAEWRRAVLRGRRTRGSLAASFACRAAPSADGTRSVPLYAGAEEHRPAFGDGERRGGDGGR